MLKINLTNPRACRVEFERLSRGLVDDLEQKLEEAREDRAGLLEACECLEEQFQAYADRNVLGLADGWRNRIGLPQDREFARAAIAKAKARTGQ